MAKSKYESFVQPKLAVMEDWARDGLTDKDIAARLGISEDSLYEYKKRYSEFSEALKRGKEIADRAVENALFKRAVGYSYREITEEQDRDGNVRTTKIVTKEVAPDTTAQIFWLKNRRPDLWRDKQNVEHSMSEAVRDIKISFVDKTRRSGAEEQDPKIVGDYTPPVETQED